MRPVPNLQRALVQQILRCFAGLLLGTAVAHAADGGGSSNTLIRSAPWQQVVRYLTQQLPICKEYPDSAGVASIRGDRISLYYADRDYGTIDSFPLRAPFTAEAHSANGNWRLLVHFRRDVVTTDIPYLNGHGQSDLFYCDGDRDTTQGLATALARLHELLAGGIALEPEGSELPEVTVRGWSGVTMTRERNARTSSNYAGELVTATARVNVADLDLSTAHGTDELFARIRATAQRVCHQLEVRYPDGLSDASGLGYTHQNCVRDAIAAATKHVDEAAAAPKP